MSVPTRRMKSVCKSTTYYEFVSRTLFVSVSIAGSTLYVCVLVVVWAFNAIRFASIS